MLVISRTTDPNPASEILLGGGEADSARYISFAGNLRISQSAAN